MTSRSYVLIALVVLIGGAVSTPVSIRADCGPDIIDTVAGGGVGDGGPATAAALWARAVALGPDGGIYVADISNHRIRKVDPARIITTIAGTGVAGYSGDGGPATEARINAPTGIAVDAYGNTYIADQFNHRIRKVDAAGVITTVAGNGSPGDSGDGGPATAATLRYPTAVAVGADSSLYVADNGNHRIRKIDANGVIRTVAGTGVWGYGGDGGLAIEARLYSPAGMAASPDGSLYFADRGNHRIRKVDPGGIISTVAGTGVSGFSGDGGPAAAASVSDPIDVALMPDGGLLIADWGNRRARKVSAAGIIGTVAGNGAVGYPEDGVAAIETGLWGGPTSVAVGADGGFYLATGLVRMVDSAGIIVTVAGTGYSFYGGDGAPATEASLHFPQGVACGGEGALYIADTGNNRIRKVDAEGVITTVAGGGRPDEGLGDGGPATAARLQVPRDVALGPDGGIYIADHNSFAVRKVDSAGIITTIAGNGTPGYSGDGGLATEATVNSICGLASAPDGSLYIADTGNSRIRKVDPGGIITTVAGTGVRGFAGDGGLAVEASFRSPLSIAVGPDGSLYIADQGNHRIRRVDLAGIITTVAGNGERGYSGDGAPAIAASLYSPQGVAFAADGSWFIVDSGNLRVRKVDGAGVITTVAGNGERGYSGDGGPAMEASFWGLTGLAVGADGSLHIADKENKRIRKVSAPPCCGPDYQPAAPLTGEAVTFHANASAGGGMATCQWDFGDGAHAGGCDASHVYSSPGEYLACVTVTNAAGVSHSCCTTVAVTCECDVGLVPFWCRLPPGKVGHTRRGQIAAWNRGGEPCDVVLRVSNGAGMVVFETAHRLPPLRWTRARFAHTLTAEDMGPNPWTWEIWPVECEERTPADNVVERPVRVMAPPR